MLQLALLPAEFTILLAKGEPADPVVLAGKVEDGSLVFTFENTTKKTIAYCSFLLQLPEGVTLIPNGGTYQYEKGDATAGMSFSVKFENGHYTVKVDGGEFEKPAGTIISLALKGKTEGDQAKVSNITFKDSNGYIISSMPKNFTIDIPIIDNGDDDTSSIELKGEVKNGNLIFKYENNSGKKIANCSFQLKFDEGVSIALKSNGKIDYKKGVATADVPTVDVKFNEKTGKYTVAIYGDTFDDDTADGVIISFPLEGDLSGKNVTVSSIAFGDPDAVNICRPAEFKIQLAEKVDPVGSVDLMGEVKDGKLVFTFKNTTNKNIANCKFQFELPDGISVKYNSTGDDYEFEEGDATSGMKFSISSSGNKYTITINGGKFNRTTGTIISLPLWGKTGGGQAKVSNVVSDDPDGNNICHQNPFTIDIPMINTGSVELIPEVKADSLIFMFENTSDRIIANCDFQLILPEGISIEFNSINNDYQYLKGDATKDMIFSVAYNKNTKKYTITVYGGEFDKTTGTIISLPLKGRTEGGVATVSTIAFGDPFGNNICRPEDLTIAIPSIDNDDPTINLMGEVKDGNLVFRYENNSDKKIANCSFQLKFDEGVSIALKSNGKIDYKKGGATADVPTVDVKFNEKTTADGVIITFPLEGDLTGKNVTVSSIAFGDPDAANICRPDEFTILLAKGEEPIDYVELMGEVKDNKLAFTFKNTSDKKIARCNFQFTLPEGLSVKRDPTGNKYEYEEGDATAGLIFYIRFNDNDNKYTVHIIGEEFDETAGNTIIYLPLQGKSGGKANVTNIAFDDSDFNNICKPKNIQIDIPAIASSEVDLKGEVKDGKLVFTFENKSDKKITACNFQFELPEGLTVGLKGKKYQYDKGTATEDMDFNVSFNNNKYKVILVNGEFNETKDNTIISLTLQGRSGGEISVSNIAFGGSDGKNISRPENFTLDVPSASKGGVDLKGEVKNGDLVFTFENNSDKTIANCNFRFVLPEGIKVKENQAGTKLKYKEGDATEGMTFIVTKTNNNNEYLVAIFGGSSKFYGKAGTIITLPLEGTMVGEAAITTIAFGDPDAVNICHPESFTIALVGVELKGEIKDDNLVFSYENNSGKDIAACNFQFVLPEGVTLMTNNETRNYVEENAVAGRFYASSDQTYNYTAGDATEGMEFHISCLNNVYTVTISGGKFNEDAGNTIISLPLEGDVTGETTVSDIVFEDPDNSCISQSESLTIEVVDVELKGEVKDGNLIFTFEDKSSKPITNCNFEFVLPEGISLVPNDETYKYIEGDATTGMTFSVTFSNGVYTVNVYGGKLDKTVGNTIIMLPLRGMTEGQATVSNISFGDPEGNITRPDGITINVTGVGVKGDVDGNGSVGLGDIEMILAILAGGANTPAADVDGNGSVGLGDIEAILRILAGGE